MQYARITPRKPRKGLFLFRYSFIPPRHGKRRTRQNKGLVFVWYLGKGQKETFLIRFRGAMRKQPSFSRRIPRKGVSPGRKRKKTAIYRKTPIFAYKQGGVTVKRTPRKTARRGAVSMLRFDSTYTLTPKTPKIYIALKMHGIFLVFPLFCVIMIIRNIKNTRYCCYVCDTKNTTTKPARKGR